MSKTSISRKNINKPAPKWYRIAKKVIYALTGSSILSGTMQRFGISNDDCLLVVGWLILVVEIFDSILANGETYSSSSSSTSKESEIGGGGIKNPT